MSINVSSEIGTLTKVIVHRPDIGISRVWPKRAEELLFDDIVFLPQMQKEHDVLTDLLKAFLGDDHVMEITDLIEQTLDDEIENKRVIIERVARFEELPYSFTEKLISLDNKTLADVLVTGYLVEDEHIIFDPIPNFIFTRDIAVVINDHVIITKAYKDARHRENLLTRFVFWRHPIFKALRSNNKVINLNEIDVFPPSKDGQQVSLEGGDVMVLNSDFLLIGCSERTSMHGIELLKDVLFAKGVIKNVVVIIIPSDRSFMHIDTLFTMIDKDEIIAYKPIIFDGISSNVQVYRSNGGQSEYSSVKQFFQSEINHNMRFIFAGEGKSPFQEREQWTDGCNLVALKPGVAIAYDRNAKTDNALRESGYTIVDAKSLIKKIKTGKLKPEEITKTIIHIPSSELSRARGGSHCMTCPIERKPV